MYDLYVRRGSFCALMFAAVAFGGVFFVTNNLDFIIAAMQQGKFHIPNLAYTLSRIVGGILLPAVFIVPTMFEFWRIKLSKLFFIVYGVLHLLTLTWIFYFMAYGIGSLFSNTDIVVFQQHISNAFVSTHVYWDTYEWQGSLFTLLYGLLCIYTGICFDDNRKKVRLCVILVVLLRFLFPAINNLLTGGTIYSVFWLTNNYADLLSVLFYCGGIILASVNDPTWIELIWDETVDSERRDRNYD